jgi:hypothetical protein
MATVVPFSHSQRWRSRSRTASMDAMILGELSPSTPASSSGTCDDDSSSEGENEDWIVDSPQSATGLVMPRGFTPAENRQPVSVPLGTLYNNASSPPRDRKAMERRRATGSDA